MLGYDTGALPSLALLFRTGHKLLLDLSSVAAEAGPEPQGRGVRGDQSLFSHETPLAALGAVLVFPTSEGHGTVCMPQVSTDHSACETALLGKIYIVQIAKTKPQMNCQPFVLQLLFYTNFNNFNCR